MVKLTAAQCPNCGADIEVNKDLKNSICQYCGSTILVEEAIQKVELTGKIKVEGIHGSSDKIEDIKKFMKLKEYTNAINIANDIISKEPFNYEAQALKIKCSIYNFAYDKFDPKSSTYTDKDSWAKVDEIVNIYNRMNEVDEEKIGEKELTDVKEKLEELIKWHDERVADEEKCKIISQKIGECVRWSVDYFEVDPSAAITLSVLDNLIGLRGYTVNGDTKLITTCVILNEGASYNGKKNYVTYKFNEVLFNRDSEFLVNYKTDAGREYNWKARADKYDSLDDIIKIFDDYEAEGRRKTTTLDEYCEKINKIIEEENRGFFKMIKFESKVEEKLKLDFDFRNYDMKKFEKILTNGQVKIAACSRSLKNGTVENLELFANMKDTSKFDETVQRCEDFIYSMEKKKK